MGRQVGGGGFLEVVWLIDGRLRGADFETDLTVGFGKRMERFQSERDDGDPRCT